MTFILAALWASTRDVAYGPHCSPGRKKGRKGAAFVDVATTAENININVLDDG